MDEKNTPCLCTVLLISYNHGPYIREAIESVIAQKTKYKFKINIFDDCSTDETQEIIKEYAQKYPELITSYIAEKNMGAQGNIWRAYRSVDTKYCILLECDDYWCNVNKLQLQISAMEQHPECSFCGHNTRLITLDEKCREYEEGILCCRNKILKNKNIYSFEDFHFVNDGGYIPYVSARLIRSDCFDLSKIKYKESFLFDHTQFYYLLLKGKYYYIDKPMTVYRRTGTGTCSEESPLVFLNTFVQNSLDFNKETNYIIADKIFMDCNLQASFRLMLNTQHAAQSLSDLVKADCINLASCVALGDTYIWAGLAKAIEQKYDAPVHFIIKPQYEIVMKMYGITNYTIFTRFDSVDWDKLKKSRRPYKGKLFMAHPTFYNEYHLMYDALRYKRLETDFVTYFKKFAGLDESVSFEAPIWCPQISPELKERLGSFPLEKIVIFSMDANTCAEYEKSFWEKRIEALYRKGYRIFINSAKTAKWKHAENWNLSISDSVALAARCHRVYALRSGYCDLIHNFCHDLRIYYNDYADLYIFGLYRMFGHQSNVKECVRFSEKIKDYNTRLQVRALKEMPLLFGVIRIPDSVYHFYNNHRSWFRNRKIINFLVKWM